MNQPTPSRHLVAIALVVVAGLVSVIAGLVVGGGADPLQFSDPGPVVRFGAPFAKLIMNFSMATAVGSLVLSAYAADSKERLKLAPVAAWSAAIWALAASVNFVMTYLSVSGSEISYGQTFSDSLWLFATDIELGVLLVWNLGIAFVLSLTTLAFVGRRMTAINAAIAIAGLYPLAASGHASSDAGHALAVNSLLMHLVGISIWVGGLIALYVVFRGQSERSAVLVSRYSSLALVAFIMVA
ncbi:MAG: copper transporter, partial [Micrococcales bacterium]|nr:copper transporter [Micrococcales bacterium]